MLYVFQFLLIAVIAVAGVYVFRMLPGVHALALKRILALVFFVGAVFAVIFPGLLTHVANFFGIGRGADLLLYVLVLAFIVFAISVTRAKARSDARVTELARAVALAQARLEDSEKSE